MSYNVHLLKINNDENCRPSSGGALFFYAELPPDFFSLPTINTPGVNYSVNSRQLVTNSLDPNDAKWSLSDQEAGNVMVLSCEPEVTTTTTSAEVTTERTTTHVDNQATATVPEVTTTEEMSLTAVFKYTLTTANSPDCERSLVGDNSPVRMQYRTISVSDGEKSNTSVSEWMDFPNMSGKH